MHTSARPRCTVTCFASLGLSLFDLVFPLMLFNIRSVIDTLDCTVSFISRRIGALSAVALLVLVSCGNRFENDPVYQALKANPPTEIPARHLPRLRRGSFSCDVFEEGTARQYLTCWWSNGLPPKSAYLSYYGGGVKRPHPSKINAPGGQLITEKIRIP